LASEPAPPISLGFVSLRVLGGERNITTKDKEEHEAGEICASLAAEKRCDPHLEDNAQPQVFPYNGLYDVRGERNSCHRNKRFRRR
jgi:hypothetical protein